MKISELIEFNPIRTLKKGSNAPFIDMAALPVNARDVEQIYQKPFVSGSKFKNGDTLFARITPCLENGKTAKVSGLKFNEIAHGSTEFIVLSAKNPSDEDFIYYLARLPEFRAFAKSRMEGTSGRQRVSWQALSEFDFDFPDILVRKENAEMLKALDDKIQLNTQTNQTLEQIAQAIFKSWFVDFEPVKAKMQGGNLAAMEAISGKNSEELHRLQTENPTEYQKLWAIADEFPDEIGEDGVPVGWEVKRIDDVIQKIPVGEKYSSKTVSEIGKVPVLDQGRSGLIGYHNDEAGVKANIENPVIVFANHTCYMRLISYDFSAIQNVFAFKGKESNIYWTYLATLGKQEFVEYKGHFPDFLIKEITVPVVNLTDFFGIYVKEIFSKISFNERENKTLSETRDLLLPKLLNRELING